MKNSTNRILQVVKWTCSFAVILLAVSLCQTAFAQVPVFIDTGFNSNNPPTPGPNDVYQTNTLNQVYSSSGETYQTDQQPPAGVTFMAPGTIGSATLVAVTNVMIGTSGLAADYGTSGAGTGNPTNDDQSYVLSFYQIQGVASGLSTTAVQITNIVSSNGLVKTMGDWMSFSNFAVFLTPGTTNAFALSRLAYKSGPTTNYFNGEGFMHLMVVTNNIGSGPATHYFGSGAAAYNGMTVMITNGTAINYGGTSQINQSVYRTNASTVFDVGISTSFLPAVFLAQPQNYYEVLPGTSTATLIATAAGSSNTAYGINGYWMVTNGTYPSGQILANAYEANATIATTVIPSAIGAAGATVTSTLTISNWTTSDAGSYVFIVTNSPDGVSLLTRNSAFATLSIIGVQPNSFASAIDRKSVV